MRGDDDQYIVWPSIVRMVNCDCGVDAINFVNDAHFGNYSSMPAEAALSNRAESCLWISAPAAWPERRVSLLQGLTSLRIPKSAS